MQEAFTIKGPDFGSRGFCPHSWRTTFAILGFASLLFAVPVRADRDEDLAANIRQLRSRHIRLYTDLDAITARQRLTAMEDTLERASDYWGRALPGKIEAFLVDQLENWPADAFPLSEARIVLKHIGGGTAIDWPDAGGHVKLRTCVYARNRAGIAEHEIVHAYCFQTFGRAGPDWYQEGMAEVLARSGSSQDALCRQETLELLKSADALSVTRIVRRTSFTKELRQSVDRFHSLPGQPKAQFAFDLNSWRPADGRTLTQTRLAYAESWALCQLLHESPNYRRAFRQLGRAMLTKGNICPSTALEPVREEIDFELRQFQQHIADGYRIDLCPWPWKTEFTPLAVDESIALSLAARAGFQATRVLVDPEEEYHFQAVGKWRLTSDGVPLDATGDPDGWGGIQAVILDEFQLSSPFALTPECSFRPSRRGNLYLRCRDRWNQLGDNHGCLEIQVTRAN